MIGGWVKRPPCTISALYLTEKPQQQRAAGGFARGARRPHWKRHRALNFIHVEIAGGVSVGDPGLLHRAQLCSLLVIQRAHQTLEVLIEEVVPDRPFDAIAIHRAEIGIASRRVGARRGDELELALTLTLVHVVLVFGRAISDCRDLLRG